MIPILACLAISVLTAYGIAVALNEKGDRFPVNFIAKPLRILLTYIHPKCAEVLDCSACLSFWTSLLSDMMVRWLVNDTYFLWPISGFITFGITFTIYELLFAIENGREKNDESGIE